MSKRAFEYFADIIKVLQHLPHAKLPWHSNFTIAVCTLPANLPSQHIGYALLAPQTRLSQASYFHSSV